MARASPSTSGTLKVTTVQIALFFSAVMMTGSSAMSA
jgi:hypothetical protein